MTRGFSTINKIEKTLKDEVVMFKEDKLKIKIMFVNYSLDVGGIETLILEICRRLDKKKYEPAVCVFVPNGSLTSEFNKAGIKVFVINKREGVDFLLPFKICNLLKRESINVLNTHNQTAWFYGAMAAFMCGVPLVQTEHTTATYHNYHSKRWMILEKILSFFTRKITTVAKSVADFMKDYEGINAEKIEVIYNGVDYNKYAQNVDVKKKRDELGIQEDNFVCGNVARLFPNKNQRLLIDSFSVVLKKNPKSKLFIAGDGPLKGDLLNQVRDLSLEKDVFLIGNRRDIPELLKVFDVFLLPSLREGLPVVLLEAMASGLPVIASDVDGNGELVINGESGILVNSNDKFALVKAIIDIMLDEKKRIKMGQSGLLRVKEKFSFESVIKQYENVFNVHNNLRRKE